MYPRIVLGIDNCFASKRWVRPSEWARVISGLGLRYVEASADTECDPLYMGGAFTRDWIEDVRVQCEKYGIAVKNVYSGHGTYATCGLSHYDGRVIRRFTDQWMKAQIDTAKSLGAGFGFFAHGFEELLLQDDGLYSEKLAQLYATLAEIAEYGQKQGVRYVGIEQMYSPHQPPWRIEDARELMKAVLQCSGAPFYITEDLGHMNGQQYFARPTAEEVRSFLHEAIQGKRRKRLWLGSDRAHDLFRRAADAELPADKAVDAIMAEIDAHPHLFSKPEDWSIQAWVSRLGCYSPIVHLQQSDGKSSPHWTFSAENNAKGVAQPAAVLRALAESYSQPDDPDMPPKCDEIVLTFEPFISTAGNVYDLLDEMEESVAYWRRYVPEDGMSLCDIVDRL